MAVPIAALIAAMLCFQLGAVFAKSLFPMLGASGTTAMRLALAAVFLCLVWRPWRLRLNGAEARNLLAYGVVLGCMNFFFYLSLTSIPLGIAVALEFTGPLGLAMAASRRAVDFLWIAVAGSGIGLLLPWRGAAGALAPAGVACALASGLFWALYIYFGRKAGAAHGARTAAVGMVIAALIFVPIGAAQAGVKLFSLSLLPAGCAMALLSSALPYSFEVFAMPKLPTRTVGVLMSLAPALGALLGLAFLGETLTRHQWAGILGIVAASAGSAATRSSPLRQPLPD